MVFLFAVPWWCLPGSHPSFSFFHTFRKPLQCSWLRGKEVQGGNGQPFKTRRRGRWWDVVLKLDLHSWVCLLFCCFCFFFFLVYLEHKISKQALDREVHTRTGLRTSLPQLLAAAEFQTENISGRRQTKDREVVESLSSVLYTVPPQAPRHRVWDKQAGKCMGLNGVYDISGNSSEGSGRILNLGV